MPIKLQWLVALVNLPRLSKLLQTLRMHLVCYLQVVPAEAAEWPAEQVKRLFCDSHRKPYMMASLNPGGSALQSTEAQLVEQGQGSFWDELRSRADQAQGQLSRAVQPRQRNVQVGKLAFGCTVCLHE